MTDTEDLAKLVEVNRAMTQTSIWYATAIVLFAMGIIAGSIGRAVILYGAGFLLYLYTLGWKHDGRVRQVLGRIVSYPEQSLDEMSKEARNQFEKVGE